MSKPTSTGLPAISTPTGFWKVLGVIAERLPQRQLIWLALMICFLVFSLGYMAYASVDRAVESKPAAAIAGCIEQWTTSKSENAP